MSDHMLLTVNCNSSTGVKEGNSEILRETKILDKCKWREDIRRGQ